MVAAPRVGVADGITQISGYFRMRLVNHAGCKPRDGVKKPPLIASKARIESMVFFLFAGLRAGVAALRLLSAMLVTSSTAARIEGGK